MTATKKSTSTNSSPAFSADEQAAMRAHADEVKATRGRGKDKAAIEAQACLDAIAAMPPGDRELATQVHELVTTASPELAPKTWYGMPAYTKDGKLICYFKAAAKFKMRYAQLGFEDAARLDDGTMWPTVWAVTKVGKAEEARITELVKTAAG